MDSELRKYLNKIHSQIEKLFECEKLCGELEANEKSLYAKLFLDLDQSQSIEMRKNMVYASSDWGYFAKGLVLAQAQRNQERRRLELFLKAFDAAYLTFKINNSVINREK